MHAPHAFANPMTSSCAERWERRPPHAARVVLACLMTAAALLALGALFAQPSLAADATATNMSVSVQPEYDDPRVLVVMQADLEPNLQLPAQITFNVPKGADIGMACEIDSSGGHACKAYQTVDRGDYQSITYSVEKEHKVFLEYYYEAFPSTVTKRKFTYTFRPGFPVDTLSMSMQKPLRSTAFNLTPEFPQTTTDPQGLTNYVEDFSGVTPGKPITVKVSYSKPDHKTSVPPKDDSAKGGASSTSSAGGISGGSNRTLLILLAVGVFAALMFAGYKHFRPAPAGGNRGGRKRPRTSPAPRTRQTTAHSVANSSDRGSRGAGKTAKPTRSQNAKETKFCTSCGCQLRTTDSFCAECGEEQT